MVNRKYVFFKPGNLKPGPLILINAGWMNGAMNRSKFNHLLWACASGQKILPVHIKRDPIDAILIASNKTNMNFYNTHYSNFSGVLRANPDT